MKDEIMDRYSVIHEKNPREILLLRGSGCTWRKCRFCNYHLDFCKNQQENYQLNAKQLKKVTGIYKKLEIINSGSFVDLSEDTMDLIAKTCLEKGINALHFESHWNHREQILALKTRYSSLGITVKTKIGIETFDDIFRESYLVKGILTKNPREIAEFFDECCLLQGIAGQTASSMIHDIETGLENFERVCVNIMQENGMPIKPDPSVIAIFIREVYPLYRDDFRVDILINNTDFGVGGAI